MDVSAFKPAGMFPFSVLESTGARQTKLIRDAEGKWYLLAFRSDPPDGENGTDYVDVYGVDFEPFAISYLLDSVMSRLGRAIRDSPVPGRTTWRSPGGS
jgi:hypothetical protein